jgi:thioredoxin
MKKTLFIALLVSLVNMASCQNGGNSKGIIKQTISVDQFDQKLSTTAGAQLIDVRTPEEYAGGHLKNAVNINYNSDDFEAQSGKLDKSKPVFVYCLSGGRSSNAADKMEEMGFSEIYNMDGGIMKWSSAGKTLDKGTSAEKPVGITTEDFNKMISGNKYVLVDYNAKWCEPCKKMLPVLESLAEKKKDKMSLLKIDADDNKELLKQKGISGIPYLELYQDGKLVWKHDGFIEEDQLLKETKL